ncbi:hypothetical protein J5U21_02291 [Saccharolobus shibatae]|uniref:Uncharacterized protein n=1 Tax=Saccharolobus shibatae TaxID=2286 RepID=A0A8F5GX31_9CREN|nr:hypothetical protein J5U21_02291 [Saccharolobus shibatae]
MSIGVFPLIVVYLGLMFKNRCYILSVGIDHIQIFSEPIYDSISWRKYNIHIGLKIDC